MVGIVMLFGGMTLQIQETFIIALTLDRAMIKLWTELSLNGSFLHHVRGLNPVMRSMHHIDQVLCPLRI